MIAAGGWLVELCTQSLATSQHELRGSRATVGGWGLHCEQFLLWLKQFTLKKYKIFTDIAEALLWEKHAVDSWEHTLQIFLAVSIGMTHPALTSQNWEWTSPFSTRQAEPRSPRRQGGGKSCKPRLHTSFEFDEIFMLLTVWDHCINACSLIKL